MFLFTHMKLKQIRQIQRAVIEDKNNWKGCFCIFQFNILVTSRVTCATTVIYFYILTVRNTTQRVCDTVYTLCNYQSWTYNICMSER